MLGENGVDRCIGSEGYRKRSCEIDAGGGGDSMQGRLCHCCPWSTPLFYQRITEKNVEPGMIGGVGTRSQASALAGGSPMTHPESQINLMASLLSLL